MQEDLHCKLAGRLQKDLIMGHSSELVKTLVTDPILTIDLMGLRIVVQTEAPHFPTEIAKTASRRNQTLTEAGSKPTEPMMLKSGKNVEISSIRQLDPRQAIRYPTPYSPGAQPYYQQREADPVLKAIREAWQGEALYGVNSTLAALKAKRREIFTLYYQEGENFCLSI